MGKGGSSLAARQAVNASRATPIRIRQCKYLNNIVEQDPQAIKRVVKPKPMLGFKDFRCARTILSGIGLMHMIRKGQMRVNRGTHPSAAGQFCSPAT